MKKKVARIRKISKTRSELKEQIKNTQRSLAAPNLNQQMTDLLEEQILSMTMMKKKMGVDLLSEFVSKPIAEAISPKTMDTIRRYNEIRTMMSETATTREKEPTTEKSKTGSNKTTPEKVKITKPLEPVKSRKPIKKKVVEKKKSNYDNNEMMIT